MKQIWIIVLLVLLGIVGYFGYQKFTDKNKPASEVQAELIAHFQKSGVSAKRYEASEEEKAVVANFLDNLSGALKDSGTSSNKDSKYEGFALSFPSVPTPVKIYVYKKSKDAQADYIKKYDQESKSEELDDRNNRPHDKKDFYINNNLLMEIDHFKVTINSFGNLVSEPVKIDESLLDKIVTAFNSF